MQPEPNTGRNAERATKAEQDLVEMVTVLRTFLGNRTTSAAWRRHMQSFGGAGWSKPSVKRRLKVLKDREWIRIVGEPDADLERAPEGSLFEATEIARGTSSPLGSDWVRESADMNGAADAAAKAAMELVQRLNKGKPNAA